MTSAADTTRAIKKEISRLKILWETIQSFKVLRYLSNVIVNVVIFTVILFIPFIIFYLTGYLIMVIIGQPVVFLGPAPPAIGAVLMIALWVTLITGSVIYNLINVFIARYKETKENANNGL